MIKTLAELYRLFSGYLKTSGEIHAVIQSLVPYNELGKVAIHQLRRSGVPVLPSEFIFLITLNSKFLLAVSLLVSRVFYLTIKLTGPNPIAATKAITLYDGFLAESYVLYV